MTDMEQRKAAKEFATYWTGKGDEKGESQKFWLSLLGDVFGVEHPEQFISFENRVFLGHTSFIDGYIDTTKVLIEQKALGKDLKKPIKQSDGSMLTPFQQAKRYVTELPVSKHPRWVVTCNFEEFLVYDMDQPGGDPEEIFLRDLPEEYYRLRFLTEDEAGIYYGAIDLRKLIIAREHTDLESIISRNYPVLYAGQKINEVLEKLKDYAEDSFPVLDNDDCIIGIITAQDIVESIDDEMVEDYVRLGGLSVEEDLNERVSSSMKKRMPWLLLLLFMGMGVSSVVGTFESIVSQIAVVMCFQSLILDMAGNVGTQSLAVTIRVLAEETVGIKEKRKLILKETQIGGANGFVLGFFAFFFVSVYLHLAKRLWVECRFSDLGMCWGSIVPGYDNFQFCGDADTDILP